MEEAKMLFSKKYNCPVCGKTFTSKVVKTGSARFVNTNMDLRPVYENIETLKYDAVRCPECGYAALESYFGKLSQAQISMIKARVSAGFNKRSNEEEYYTYESALERYKLCLLSAMVKQGMESEIGYICLKISWLLQSKAEWLKKEALEKGASENEKEIQTCLAEEMNYSLKALEYLDIARMQEDYPICSMNEPTLNYLMAALNYKADRLDQATKNLGYVSSSREATDRLKDKAYDLKNMITKKKKEAE